MPKLQWRSLDDGRTYVARAGPFQLRVWPEGKRGWGGGIPDVGFTRRDYGSREEAEDDAERTAEDAALSVLRDLRSAPTKEA